MTNSDDLKRLIASPYDSPSDPSDDSRSVYGWMMPLVAGIVGFMIAIAFVAFTSEDASQTAPEIDGPITSLGPEVAVVFEEAVGFPQDFTPIDDAVGVRPIAMFDIDGRTYVSLAPIVSGAEDPAAVSMRSIADWYIEAGGETISGYNQTSNDLTSGGVQLGFDGTVMPLGSTLVLRQAASVASERITLIENAPPELLIDEPMTVEVGGVSIVIDRLFYNDVWGHVEWHSPEGVPATVEVIVSFLGTEGIVNDTDLPLRMISFNSAAVFFDVEGPFEVPAWNVVGQATLDRHGPFRYDESSVQSVLVEVVVSVATAAESVIEIPLDLPVDGG